MRTVRNGLTFLRALGVMYGAACGDALGAPFEFWPAAWIASRRPFLLGDPRYMDGACTDDTGMSLALARGLLKGGPRGLEDHVGQEFIWWLDGDPRGVGFACATAISNARRRLSRPGFPGGNGAAKRAWSRAAKTAEMLAGYSTDGNGALMRCAFCGLFAKSMNQARDLSVRQAAMTHTGAAQREACAWYATTIWSLSRSRDPWRAWSRRKKQLFSGFEPDEYPANPDGTAVSTMRAVVYVVDRFYGSPARAGVCRSPLISAVSLGGDTDTVACLVGGLLGAIYGVDGVPKSWRRALNRDVREEILRVTRALFRE